ncbi:MAG TPA: flagellar biosynthesis protein FlgM [Treponema sp.]|nr:flagellar biosynthesis protein FlgM [Treponema sp.]
MMIDKISRVSQLGNVQGTKRTSAVQELSSALDEISVSAEAKEMADAFYINKVSEETPDVRSDLVEQIKQKIRDPNYLSEAVIAATADQILSAYGF